MYSNVSHTRKRGSRCANNLVKYYQSFLFEGEWWNHTSSHILLIEQLWEISALQQAFHPGAWKPVDEGWRWMCLCVINKGLPAPASCLFWSLQCSWHIFYKSQPGFLPVANCMHISAPCDQPPFLNHPSLVSLPPLLMRTSWLIIKVIFYLQGKAVTGVAGAPQLHSVFLWRITRALMTITCCFRLETEEWFWWLEINSCVYSL